MALVPYSVAYITTIHMLSRISNDELYSPTSVKLLDLIAKCSLVVSLLALAGLPYAYVVAEQDYAPGLIIMSLVCVGVPLAIFTLTSPLRELLGDIIDRNV